MNQEKVEYTLIEKAYKDEIKKRFSEIDARIEFEKHEKEMEKKIDDARRMLFEEDYEEEINECDLKINGLHLQIQPKKNDGIVK